MSTKARLVQSIKIIALSGVLGLIAWGCGPVAQSVPKTSLNSTPSKQQPAGGPQIPAPGEVSTGSPNPEHPRQRAIRMFNQVLESGQNAEIKSRLALLTADHLSALSDAISVAFIGGSCEGEQVISESDHFREIGPSSCKFTYLVSQEFTDGKKFRSISALITASTDAEIEPELKLVIPSQISDQWL